MKFVQDLPIGKLAVEVGGVSEFKPRQLGLHKSHQGPCCIFSPPWCNVVGEPWRRGISLHCFLNTHSSDSSSEALGDSLCYKTRAFEGQSNGIAGKALAQFQCSLPTMIP